MTITLDLAPDMEAYLRAKAAQEGLAAEVVAKALIAQAMKSDQSSQKGVSLNDYGISPAQAAELRARLASFADEWEQPGMEVYDNYDAAKAHIEAR